MRIHLEYRGISYGAATEQINYYLVPKGMTRAEYDEERRQRIREQEDRDNAARLSALGLNETIRLAHELHEKYRDVPVSIKMSHETYRQLVVTRNA